ncbi:hypothetical protein FQR65_LT13758 [Abscondita terminalis]|nr:hypothetical protein FQR65_LT13758 [Abscondita terminalis]
MIGCDAMIMKKQSEDHYTFPYLDQYNVNDQEFESIENDFFLDPLIRQQVQQRYDIKYKIPEAYIRTLPVDNDFDLITGIPYKYYKNSTVCSSLLTFTIFGTVLIGLLICVVKIVQSMQAIETHVHIVAYSDLQQTKETANNIKSTKIRSEKIDDESSSSLIV